MWHPVTVKSVDRRKRKARGQKMAAASLAKQELVREISRISKHAPHSLVHLSLVAYLKFLEEECASYVLLTTLNSVLWNPVKEKLFDTLKHHLNSTFKGAMFTKLSPKSAKGN